MKNWKAPVAAVLATAMAMLFGPSPAVGDDGREIVRLEIPEGAIPVSYLVADRSGKPISNYTVRTEITSTKRYLVFDVSPDAVLCQAWPAPGPTYSASNHTLHYNLQAQCNTAIPVRVRMSLWSGPSEGSITTYQDSTDWKYGAGSAFTNELPAKCLDWGYFAYWRLFMYSEGDTNYDGVWEHFTPYPGETTRYQECVDIQ